LTLIKRGWEKIHHVKKLENMGKNLGKAQENMGKSPINGGF
jgi:hypothetical protein